MARWLWWGRGTGRAVQMGWAGGPAGRQGSPDVDQQDGSGRFPWKETRAQYSRRLRDVVAAINGRHNVEGLCKGLPIRLDTLKSRQGDRLKS